ncbi:SAM-dependent methyltransferase [Luteitalea sp.]|jgi:SAM-dependent methyltransferase|uniref:SAM-dependent methyltransferase n=1 Tax=Luteitalea sp. TaxID=2004800 RepID=UPI0037CC87D7
MSRITRVGRSALVALCLFTPGLASGQAVQDPPKPFEPVSGQAGKDVVWVPTPQSTVDAMLDLAKLTPSDHLIDLGAGNGITVITAAKRGATAVGVEFNPDMVALARGKAQEAGVSGRATFVQGDLFEADLSKATVITLFLLPEINMKLRPSLLDLKPGTRVVANSFDMEDWEPDVRVTVPECTSWCTAMAWIVPAKVTGAWQLGKEMLTLTQRFQFVGGTLGAAGITDGRLSGAALTFTAGGRTYTGRVEGDRLVGDGWSATRLP